MSITKAQLDALNAGVLDSLGAIDNPDLSGTALQDAMYNIAVRLSEDLRKSATDKGVVATKTLRSSIDPTNATLQGDAVEVSIVMDSQWRYAEYGRKKGRRPPIKAIEEWITAKGINVRKNNQQSGQSVLKARRSMAFAIAKRIGDKGTIKRFRYKGSGFIKSVMTKENIRAISQHLSTLQGEKIRLYFKFS